MTSTTPTLAYSTSTSNMTNVLLTSTSNVLSTSTSSIPVSDTEMCTELFANASATLGPCLLDSGADSYKRCSCVYSFDASTASCKNKSAVHSQDIDIDAASLLASCPQTQTTSVAPSAVLSTAAGSVMAGATPTEEPNDNSWLWWTFGVLLACCLVAAIVGAVIYFMRGRKAPSKTRNVQTLQQPAPLSERSSQEKRPQLATYEPLQNDGVPFPVPETLAQQTGAVGYGGLPTMTGMAPGVEPGAYQPLNTGMGGPGGYGPLGPPPVLNVPTLTMQGMTPPLMGQMPGTTAAFPQQYY